MSNLQLGKGDASLGQKPEANRWRNPANSHVQSEAATGTITAPAHPLGEGAYWANGGQATDVRMIESPISDREHNYHVSIPSTGGHFHVNPWEFGISDPEGAFSDDTDRLYVGVSADSASGVLETQFTTQVDSDYFDGIFDDVSDERRTRVEEEIRSRITEKFGPKTLIEYSTGGEPWDDVSVMYNKNYAADGSQVVTFDDKGTAQFTTSNLMFDLEEDAGYRAVLDGQVNAVVFQTLRDNGIDF